MLIQWRFGIAQKKTPTKKNTCWIKYDVAERKNYN